MRIKAIIFDLDGTVVNTLPFYIKAYDLTYKYFGFNLTKNQIINNFPIRLTDQCKELGILDKAEEFKNIYLKNIYKTFAKAKLFDGFIDLMTFLKDKKIKIAIVSFAFREYVNFIINNLDLRNFFDAIISFNDVKNAKPDPEAVLLVGNKLNILPSEILVIGDAKSDMLMGKTAGSKTCFFYPKQNQEIYSEKKIKDINSDFKINSLRQVKNILAKY